MPARIYTHPSPKLRKPHWLRPWTTPRQSWWSQHCAATWQVPRAKPAKKTDKQTNKKTLIHLGEPSSCQHPSLLWESPGVFQIFRGRPSRQQLLKMQLVNWRSSFAHGKTFLVTRPLILGQGTEIFAWFLCSRWKRSIHHHVLVSLQGFGQRHLKQTWVSSLLQPPIPEVVAHRSTKVCAF